MKQQVNIRMSDASRAKLDWLTERYGTQAEVVAVAVDRLYMQEQKWIRAEHPGYITDSELTHHQAPADAGEERNA